MNLPHSSARLASIRRISLQLRLVTRVILGLIAILFVGVAIPAVQRGSGFAMVLAGLLSIAYSGWGFWVLDRLFTALAAGEILGASTAKWLKLFAVWIGTVLLVPLVSRGLADLLTYGRLGIFGEEPLFPAIACFLLGAFLLMIGWILEEAAELQEEQSLTV